MVSLPDAVNKAKEFAKALFNMPPDEIRLEEVESSQEGGEHVWRITLSMPATAKVSAVLPLFSAPGRWRDRDYKTFSLSKDTGEVLAVKIREFAIANG